MTVLYRVYALVDPRTNEVRYIGYTKNSLKERLKQHLYDVNRSRSHKAMWLKSLATVNIVPNIIQLGECAGIDEAVSKEIYFISKHKNLTNSTSGGEVSKTYRKDVILKMSVNRKGKCVGSDNPMYGKKRPDLVKRNKVRNQTAIDKMANTLKIKYNTSEYKSILRRSQKTRKCIQAFKDGLLVGVYESKRELVSDLSLDRKSVNSVLKGRYKQHKGYTFKEVA